MLIHSDANEEMEIREGKGKAPVPLEKYPDAFPHPGIRICLKAAEHKDISCQQRAKHFRFLRTSQGRELKTPDPSFHGIFHQPG